MGLGIPRAPGQRSSRLPPRVGGRHPSRSHSRGRYVLPPQPTANPRVLELGGLRQQRNNSSSRALPATQPRVSLRTLATRIQRAPTSGATSPPAYPGSNHRHSATAGAHHRVWGAGGRQTAARTKGRVTTHSRDHTRHLVQPCARPQADRTKSLAKGGTAMACPKPSTAPRDRQNRPHAEGKPQQSHQQHRPTGLPGGTQASTAYPAAAPKRHGSDDRRGGRAHNHGRCSRAVSPHLEPCQRRWNQEEGEETTLHRAERPRRDRHVRQQSGGEDRSTPCPRHGGRFILPHSRAGSGGTPVARAAPRHSAEVDEIQEAVRRLQHCQHLLGSARDQSMRGNTAWNTPRFLGEILDLVQPGAILADKREEAFMTDDEGEDPTVHPADALALAEGAQEAAARTRQESSAALLLHDAAQDFRAVIGGGAAASRAPLRCAGLLATVPIRRGDRRAQRHPNSENEQAGDLHRPLRQQAERQGEAEEAEGKPPQRGETDTTTTCKWRGLAGATASQAEAVLGSLDLNDVGEAPLPPGTVATLASQATTVPWLPAPAMAAAGEPADTVPEEGGDRESPTTDSEGSHLVSLGSHRRRRAHAVCD